VSRLGIKEVVKHQSRKESQVQVSKKILKY